MNQEKNNGVVADFFASDYSAENYQALKWIAHQEMTQFMKDVETGTINIVDDLTPQSSCPELDEWVEKNDELLKELVLEIQSNILSAANTALPAHDERQIMFKDAAEGLRFYQMEKPEGYKATFAIPMHFHDWGRLVEARLYHPTDNPPQNWIPHSQLSFLLLKKTLEQPTYDDMPQGLKNHFLYAVLAHSGDNGHSYMSRAVQTCDRMQLIGAEGLYRALAYGICLMDADIKYPDDPSFQYSLPNMFDHKSVLSILEYCARNMRENIGSNHQTWQRRIAVENVVLLKVACDGHPELARRIFAPELKSDGVYGAKKRKINAEILKEAEQKLICMTPPSFDQRWSSYEVATAAIDAIKDPKGAARISDDMKRSIHRAVQDMSEIERKALYKTMQIANVFRAEQDEIDHQVCVDMTQDARCYIRAIATAAMQYAPHLVEDLKTRPQTIFDFVFPSRTPF